jgi:hypothetical protein
MNELAYRWMIVKIGLLIVWEDILELFRQK